MTTKLQRRQAFQIADAAEDTIIDAFSIFGRDADRELMNWHICQVRLRLIAMGLEEKASQQEVRLKVAMTKNKEGPFL
jgi:hypothetical protein